MRLPCGQSHNSPSGGGVMLMIRLISGGKNVNTISVHCEHRCDYRAPCRRQLRVESCGLLYVGVFAPFIHILYFPSYESGKKSWKDF